MEINILKKLKIPDKSGVYIFKHKGEILYIGKATSLRSRVRSYFGKDLIATRGPLVVDMVFKSKDIKWQETDSVLEALMLEANLIKKHQPYYNTKEKDDKSFLCVVITKEVMPQVLIIRARELKEHPYKLEFVRVLKVYGPFTNGRQLQEAMKIIRRIFPYRDDKSSKRDNYEFYKQLGLTPDINIPNEEYKKTIRNIKLFFEGKKKKVLQNLKKEMNALAKAHKFEKAGEVKRQIFALQHINDVALIKEDNANLNNFRAFALGDKGQGTHDASNHSGSLFRIEAYDIAHMSGKNMVGVMTVVEAGLPAQAGEIEKSEYKKFKIRTQAGSNDTGALREILERRFAHSEWTFPNLIVVDGSTAQINTAKKVLGKMGLHIPVVSVVKDERHRPTGIKGDAELGRKYEREILLANSEAHRFAVSYHKKMRGKNFLGLRK